MVVVATAPAACVVVVVVMALAAEEPGIPPICPMAIPAPNMPVTTPGTVMVGAKLSLPRTIRTPASLTIARLRIASGLGQHRFRLASCGRIKHRVAGSGLRCLT